MFGGRGESAEYASRFAQLTRTIAPRRIAVAAMACRFGWDWGVKSTFARSPFVIISRLRVKNIKSGGSHWADSVCSHSDDESLKALTTLSIPRAGGFKRPHFRLHLW